MTPISLNSVAIQWREFLKDVPIKTALNEAGHVQGACSVYKLQIDLIAERTTSWWYVGYTARDPKIRLIEHCSDLRTCHVTVNNSKSKLYDPEFMHGLQLISLNMSVVQGGLDANQAPMMERLIAMGLRKSVGEALLTKQPDPKFRVVYG
jgi:hypothetical protein